MDAATPQRWIPPQAETVVTLADALAHPDSLAWRDVLRRDPCLSWHFFTHHPDLSLERSASLLRHGVDIPSFLEFCLEPSHARLADWSRTSALKAYRHSQFVGSLAERLAEQVRLDPLLAHCLGQLTQLGALLASQHLDKHPDNSIYTRQLIRRASCAAWLRELVLSLDLPVESDARPELQKWTLLLQMALGLAAKTSSDHHLGQLAAGQLGLSWEQEKEFALQLAHHVPSVATTLAPEAEQMLLRSLRLVRHQPATTLSFTVRQLEKEVEDLRSRLSRGQHLDSHRLREQKLTAVAELAAGAGHEINNPLAVISGQAQYLLKGEEDLNRAKALERIISQTTRIHVLLRDLMLYARPPAPGFKQVPISKLVKQSIHAVHDLAVGRGVTLEHTLPAAKAAITCDPTLLGVAIKCLLQNAIEAAPAGGWVKLAAQSTNGKLTILVEDNGPGIPANLKENIFDPFYSGRNAGRGVGLGLSKVWRIVQLHSGDIRLITAPDKPTCFSLEVPLKPVRQQSQKLRRTA